MEEPRPLPVLDFHVHTIFSDGQLAPAELARRAAVKGCRVLGLSDHVDQSNLEAALAAALAASRALSGAIGLTLLAGVELTHVPPPQIPAMVDRARRLGADFVVVHGESPVEPVAPGTNLAAIEAGADILAHPGLLAPREAALAAERGVFLELTVRGGHSLGNGLVAALARRHGARLILNSDAHAPGDLLTPGLQMAVALGSGLPYEAYLEIMERAAAWADGLAGLAGLAGLPGPSGGPDSPADGPYPPEGGPDPADAPATGEPGLSGGTPSCRSSGPSFGQPSGQSFGPSSGPAPGQSSGSAPGAPPSPPPGGRPGPAGG